jgi:hypothetical protein
MRRQISSTLAVAAIFCGVAAPLVYGGVSYNNPAGGWRYTYQGILSPGIEGLPDGYGHGDDTAGLDGTWEHGQGDKWDGTAPGNPALGDPGNAPGGAGTYTEADATYLRIQDAGDPEPHGWPQGSDPRNSNRRVYFGHNLRQDFTELDPLPDDRILNNGVTISFRARIPNTGPLDSLYSGTTGSLSVTPWIDPLVNPNGRGTLMTNGRGTINVVQNVPEFGNIDNLIGFSLVNSTDISAYVTGGGTGSITTGSGKGGLIMNNLAGSGNSIDSTQPGTLNIIEMTDASLNQFHEFWITIQSGGTGTHQVKVYMDGSLTATTFNVTAASSGNAAYSQEQAPFLEMGISDNAGFGSFDIDFFSYKLGVITPTSAPVADPDFDNNGTVDAADFLAWQRGFGLTSGATNAQGDANGDLAVNAADLALWKSKFGGPPAVAAAVMTPEPGCVSLAVLAGIAALAGRRGRRRV